MAMPQTVVASMLAAFVVVAVSAQAPDGGTRAGRVTLTTKIKGRALPSTARRPYGASTWTDQAGVSLVWAQRWW